MSGYHPKNYIETPEDRRQTEHDVQAFKSGAQAFLGGMAVIGFAGASTVFAFEGHAEGSLVAGLASISLAYFSWLKIKDCIDHSSQSANIQRTRAFQAVNVVRHNTTDQNRFE